ncbi:Hypothetical protein PBC10988_15990 [Planctomycetales bacterium 10988]|nr:Hypothetical protein PBC10988_15990 [Planctomycetales bacterium 10988]
MRLHIERFETFDPFSQRTYRTVKAPMLLTNKKYFFVLLIVGLLPSLGLFAEESSKNPYYFNRSPLVEKPYTELPLGTIKPKAWLKDELERMAAGMTGHLDTWYPEVCGDDNGWLGGFGDTWERGPYWIDGLYPLSKLLGDKDLEAKAMRWIEWTLENQRADGQIGPLASEEREQKKLDIDGIQTDRPEDWWPRMVMLKILKQHYLATGDPRVIECLTRYFRFQLKELPNQPLYNPKVRNVGSWWAAQRGGDNMMVVLWLYNITGEKFLLDLADLIYQQTVPATDWLIRGPENKIARFSDRFTHRQAMSGMQTFHCVNLAQMMKTPIIRWQLDKNDRHLAAVRHAFTDIYQIHGQPHGLYGGDEGLHGDSPDRGSELCTAVEMMYSLEKMFEITGNPSFADRLDRITFNALPTQTTDDYRGRQYFQQTNQVQCTIGNRDFLNDFGDRVVYGLLSGYPCCTCNLHQGWPKFTQHLWMASQDGGLAAVSYAPSSVTAQVADGVEVSIDVTSGYPFKEVVSFKISTDGPVQFPLHLRIPEWASNTKLEVNGQKLPTPKSGTMHVVEREWRDEDEIFLRFPMPVRTSRWYGRSFAVERGPLVYALDIEESWQEVKEPRPDGVPESAMHRGYQTVQPKSPWNYALTDRIAIRPQENITINVAKKIPRNPWTRENAPVRLVAEGMRLPDWTIHRNSAAPPPLSPVDLPQGGKLEEITLIPYGSSTLRIAAFPWGYLPEELLSMASPKAKESQPKPLPIPRQTAKTEKPNFIFFITDDISPGDLSIYGNQKIQTPNLERLAQRGLVFDNAYLTISSCSPSRCSIITGRYPHNTGAPELHSSLPASQTTFVQTLKEAGYYTVLSGKNHMADPQQLGFEVSSDSKPSGSENWIRHLRERPLDRPFFCWFAAHDAHHAWQYDDKAPRFKADQVEVPPMLYDGPLTREELTGFYHEVSRTDHYAGELMKELEAQGIADNTYFVYCSDNGRPLPRCKTYLYESGIQTPLLILGPGIEAGRTDSLVSSLDFSATFLDLAKVKKPETVQGVSFAPILEDPTQQIRTVAFAERNWHVYQAHERAVRTGDFLYIWNGMPQNHNVSAESSVPTFPAAKELWEMSKAGKLTAAQNLLTQVPQPEEMLFNVTDDPHQFHNLAENPEFATTLREMRSLLKQWKEETGDSLPSKPTPSRQPLHKSVRKSPPFGEFPGAANDATTINHPGPVTVDNPN